SALPNYILPSFSSIFGSEKLYDGSEKLMFFSISWFLSGLYSLLLISPVILLLFSSFILCFVISFFIVCIFLFFYFHSFFYVFSYFLFPFNFVFVIIDKSSYFTSIFCIYFVFLYFLFQCTNLSFFFF